MQFLYILSMGGADAMQGALCWVELPSRGLAGLRSGDSGEEQWTRHVQKAAVSDYSGADNIVS